MGIALVFRRSNSLGKMVGYMTGELYGLDTAHLQEALDPLFMDS